MNAMIYDYKRSKLLEDSETEEDYGDWPNKLSEDSETEEADGKCLIETEEDSETEENYSDWSSKLPEDSETEEADGKCLIEPEEDSETEEEDVNWLRELLEDPETEEADSTMDKLKEKLERAEAMCGNAIKSIRDIACELNDTSYNTHLTLVAGNATSMTGSGVCLGSLLLAPLTGGISAFGLIPGVALKATGGSVCIGARIVNAIVERENEKRAEKQLKSLQEVLNEAVALGKKLEKNLSNLTSKYPQLATPSTSCFLKQLVRRHITLCSPWNIYGLRDERHIHCSL